MRLGFSWPLLSSSFVPVHASSKLQYSLFLHHTIVRPSRPSSHWSLQPLATMAPNKKRQKTDLRCSWALSAPDYIAYHDQEWGTPLYSDAVMFEFLILETFQAGLNWLMILRKRENFRAAFYNFDIDLVAQMTEKDVARLLTDKGIVRNRLKIRAAISNAKAVVTMRENGISLCDYFWQFVDYVPLQNALEGTLVSSNDLSDQISKDMKERGFKFVGTTVIYALLQATGIINDHKPTCPRYTEVQALIRPKPKT